MGDGQLKTKIINTQINIDTMKTQTIKVEGMTCNHCKANVESNLEKLAFVDLSLIHI